MTKTTIPGNSQGIYQDQWEAMVGAFSPDGVSMKNYGATSLLVSPGGSGLSVQTAAGEAQVHGFYYKNDATETFTPAFNSSGQSRIDRVVLRLTRGSTGSGSTPTTATTVLVPGTPAATPLLPALLSTSTQVDISLGWFYVRPAATSVVAADMVDDRLVAAGLDGGTGGLVKIGEQVLATTGNLGFAIIPQSFKSIRIVISARGSAAASSSALRISFNGNSATVYAWQTSTGNDTAFVGSRVTGNGDGGCGDMPAATANAGLFAGYVIDLPNYNIDDEVKNWVSAGGYSPGGTIYTFNTFGNFAPTDAALDRIRSISFVEFSQVAGSQAQLYGLK